MNNNQWLTIYLPPQNCSLDGTTQWLEVFLGMDDKAENKYKFIN